MANNYRSCDVRFSLERAGSFHATQALINRRRGTAHHQRSHDYDHHGSDDADITPADATVSLPVLRSGSVFVRRWMCFAAGLLATLILLPFVVGSFALLDSTPAAAQCAQSGNSENCTGNVSGSVTFTAPPINTL